MAGLTPEDVEKVVEVFLNRIATKDPILKKEIETNKQTLVQNMSALLVKQKPDLSKSDLADKNFIKQLTVAFVTSLTLNKLALDHNKNFCERIKAIFNGKEDLINKILDPKFDPKNLEKLLTKDEKRKLQEEIRKCCAEILNDLKKAGLIKTPELKPGAPKPKLDEEMGKSFEPYVNLYGLLSMSITGSLPAVVQCFVGNGLGLTDWNPNSGYAQIDLPNRVDDNQFGDSLSLNALAMERCLQFEGNELVDEFMKDLQTQGLAQSTAPRPRGPGDIPGISGTH